MRTYGSETTDVFYGTRKKAGEVTDSPAVLVTGGMTRLGAIIAERLRTQGYKVLCSSHRHDAGADFVADFRDSSAAVKLYLEAIKREPRLFAIVNNASLFVGKDEELEAINFTAPQKLTMLLAGKEDVKGAVVNILDSRILDLNKKPEELTPYERTKCQLLEYTRKSAALFAETIRVNAVAPGPVLKPEYFHESKGDTLLPYPPRAEDVADAVAFLLKATSTTGTIIPVDSGQFLMP
jgi:pteridine reductase